MIIFFPTSDDLMVWSKKNSCIIVTCSAYSVADKLEGGKNDIFFLFDKRKKNEIK